MSIVRARAVSESMPPSLPPSVSASPRSRRAAIRPMRALLGFSLSVWAAVTACGTGEPGPLALIQPGPGQPVSLALDSASLTVPVGGVRTLVALVRDINGTLLSASGVFWSSSNEAVATVGNGQVRGVSAGVADIIATLGDSLRAQIRVTVTPPSSGGGGGGGGTGGGGRVAASPDAFTIDLGDTVTLRASALDAAGNRVVRALGWRSLDTLVVRLANSTVTGAVSGDSARAFAVGCCAARVVVSDGSRSDTVNITVTPPPVAFVRLLPFYGLEVGVTAPLFARMFDALNRDITNIVGQQAVAWTVANAGVAAPAGGNSFRGVANGSTTVTATVQGRSATAPLIVKPNANEPGDFTLIDERDFSGTPQSWDSFELGHIGRNLAVCADTMLTLPLVCDAQRNGPRSPGFINITYPRGFGGGSSPAVLQRAFTSVGPPRLYIGAWLRLGENWEGHRTSTNKLFYIWYGNPAGARIFFEASGRDDAPLFPAMFLQGMPDRRSVLRGNVDQATQLRRGQWHHLEIFIDLGTAAQANGVLRFWLDGQLIGDFIDIAFLPATEVPRFTQVQIAPVWGGGTDTVTVPNGFTLRYDHMRISGGR